MNFQEIPQWDRWDFFIFLINFAISKGLVFKEPSFGTPSICSRWGAGSLWFGTVDFDAKNVLKILLFSCGSLIVISFSCNGGVLQNLLLFISFKGFQTSFLQLLMGYLV